MGKLRNPFALDSEGNLIYIKNKDYEHKDKYRTCFCPKCGESLVPRTGGKMIWHFAHKKNKNCTGNYESSLHLYAKEVIRKNNELLIPELKLIEYNHMHNFMRLSFLDYQKKYLREKKLLYNWINNERMVNDFKPDCCIKINNTIVAVEIRVTHQVDFCKYIKVEQANINMIEIDLSSFYNDFKDDDNNIDYTDLDNYILMHAPRKWIYISKNESWENKIKHQIEMQRNSIKTKVEVEHQIAKKQTIDNLNTASKIIQDNTNLNVFNIPVNGEYSFNCPRSVWQKKIFDTFILSKKEFIYTGKICSYIEKYSSIEIFYWKLWNSNIDSHLEAIREYLKWLYKIHILSIYDLHMNDFSKMKVISKDIVSANNSLKDWNIKFPSNNICKNCGEVFYEADKENLFYLSYFGLDKNCFEEYIESL